MTTLKRTADDIIDLTEEEPKKLKLVETTTEPLPATTEEEEKEEEEEEEEESEEEPDYCPGCSEKEEECCCQVCEDITVTVNGKEQTFLGCGHINPEGQRFNFCKKGCVVARAAYEGIIECDD